MLIFVALMLAITALSASLAPRPPITARTAPPAPPRATVSSVVLERTLDADRLRPRTITVEHGDLLNLTVTSSDADAVELQGLAGVQAVAPDTPVVFDVLADAPGEYPVVLLQAGRTAGTVRVIPRKA